MFKSLLKLQRVDTGVRIDNVITMSADLLACDLPGSRARHPLHRAGRRAAAGDSRRRARGGLDRCAAARRQAGRRRWRAGHRWGVGARFKRVDPHYFATLDIPVLAGRGFTARDRAGAPRVAIVNEALARRLAERLRHRRSRRRSSAGSCDCTRPMYENRGQAGKAEDIEIVGMIRNERVDDLETPMHGSRLRRAAPGAAPRDQADRAHQHRPVRPRCPPSARPSVRSIRVCRSATCGRWSR